MIPYFFGLLHGGAIVGIWMAFAWLGDSGLLKLAIGFSILTVIGWVASGIASMD